MKECTDSSVLGASSAGGNGSDSDSKFLPVINTKILFKKLLIQFNLPIMVIILIERIVDLMNDP